MKRINTYHILFLVILGFIIRLLFILSSPSLFEWDEAFHALVAKNMMDHPFKPMLRVDPILPFDYKAWCCNHIWLHKQPLFLWQMALSMKAFGVSVWAMRLPSALMGTIMIPLVYSIGLNWTNSKQIGFIAAILSCFHSYQLGLISGRFMLDHNDMAFTFYMTCGIYALSCYFKNPNAKRAILIGIFVGAAILIKWLTALLIFGGWGLFMILNGKSFFINNIKYFALALLITVMIALPWQLHIISAFPQEASYTYSYNVRHIFETLGHDGDNYYHLRTIFKLYGFVGVLFIPLGLLYLLRSKTIDNRITYSNLSMLLVIYLFFSLVVTTKMPAFTMPVCSLIYVLIACGISSSTSMLPSAKYLLIPLCSIAFLQPWLFYDKYFNPSESEKNRIHNSHIYKNLPDSLSAYAIFNLKPYQDIDLMFHKEVNAFTWYPQKEVVDKLQEEGIKIAVFESHTNQPVPKYMYRDDILIIDKKLK